MADRLLLGFGTIGRLLVDRSTGRSDDLFVVSSDDDRVAALRDENIAASVGDPTETAVLSALDRGFGTVIVVGDDPAQNRAAAEAAREVFPDALLVAYTGESPPASIREAIAGTADRVIEYGPAISESLFDVLGHGAGERLYKLSRVIRGIDGRLGVFMHDNPDPDAIASAIALRELARTMKTDAEACYFGEITHQENRALVNLLDLQLTNLSPDTFDPDAYDAIALVDHSRPGVNDQLPDGLTVDIVIDHHPPREPVSARFVDLRSDVGATSTLLADYYRRFGIPPGSAVATALLYGIRVDTRDFGREITESDFDAASYLLTWADVDLLERVENPSVSGETMDTVARAIRNRNRRDSVVVSGVGRITHRDSLAQAADQLLVMEGIATTVVYGIADGAVYASARTREPALDIGETMRQAYDQIGSAGGHTEMAGAQIPLGIMGEVERDEDGSLESVVSEVIENRFFEVLGLETVLSLEDGMDLGAEINDLPPSSDGG